MLRKISIYGAIAGLIVGIPLFAMSVALAGEPPLPYGMALGYLIMLVALSTVFVAVKRHRDGPLGGVIRFWPAFAMGLAISIVAGIFYVIAWEAAMTITQADPIEPFVRQTIAEARAAGKSAQEIAKIVAEWNAFRADYANPLFRIPVTLTEIMPVGLLVSLVSAGLLRNPRFLPAHR
ncbi:MAG: DUF4199 domain-containing protein [Rhizorhabdus sp.]